MTTVIVLNVYAVGCIVPCRKTEGVTVLQSENCCAFFWKLCLCCMHYYWMSVTWLIVYLVASLCLSVCLCVINVCQQDIWKTSLWSFAKFTADTSYMILWKWLTVGAVHVQDGGVQIHAQNLQFPKWRKQRLLASHIIVIVDHGSW